MISGQGLSRPLASTSSDMSEPAFTHCFLTRAMVYKSCLHRQDTVGGERYTLRVRDLASGRDLGEPVPSTSGDVVWANDNATLFYVVKDQLDRPYKARACVILRPCIIVVLYM